MHPYNVNQLVQVIDPKHSRCGETGHVLYHTAYVVVDGETVPTAEVVRFPVPGSVRFVADVFSMSQIEAVTEHRRVVAEQAIAASAGNVAWQQAGEA